MSSPSTPHTSEQELPCTAFSQEVARWITDDDTPRPWPTNEEEQEELDRVENVMLHVMVNSPTTQETIS